MNTLRLIGEFLGEQIARLEEMLGLFLAKTGDTLHNVATFEEAPLRENIRTGESHTVLFGKISKWFSDLRGLAFRDELEPLTLEFENGEKIIYRGTQAASVLLPAPAPRIHTGSFSFDGESRAFHGFHKAKIGEPLTLKAELSGIPPAAATAWFLERVSYDDLSGEWQPVTNDPLPLPEKQKPSVVVGDEGFWRWLVEYEDPLTFEGLTLYSDVFFLRVVQGSRNLVALDPWGENFGYRIKTGTIAVYFDASGFSDASTVRLQQSPTDWPFTWTDVPDTAGNEIGEAKYVLRQGLKYACARIVRPGFYRVVATETNGTATVEYTSDFRVLEATTPAIA